MGCLQSASRNSRHEDVEKYLKEETAKHLTRFKVLLLGAGESGKSTVIKQLKVLHKAVLDEQEIQHYRVTLHHNTVTSMQTFIEACLSLGLEFTTEEKVFANQVKGTTFEENRLMSKELAESVAALWKSNTIKKAFARRWEYWNLDAAPYYFDNVERFVEEGWTPSEEDCIMARVRTTGIVVTDFDEGPIHFSVVDVAGQRSERKKWIHCFDDVKALVFVVSLAGYNQVMFEDATYNRMHEQLNLFQQIVGNPIFASTPIFLFLNKKDLFESMLQEGNDLKKCFPEYTGSNDVKEALQFIQTEFEKRVDDESRKHLHVHYIAARYKKDIKYAWEELKTVLLDENKKDVDTALKMGKK